MAQSRGTSKIRFIRSDMFVDVRRRIATPSLVPEPVPYVLQILKIFDELVVRAYDAFRTPAQC